MRNTIRSAERREYKKEVERRSEEEEKKHAEKFALYSVYIEM